MEKVSCFYKWGDMVVTKLDTPCKININDDYCLRVEDFSVAEVSGIYKIKYNILRSNDPLEKIVHIGDIKDKNVIQSINETVSLFIRSSRMTHDC